MSEEGPAHRRVIPPPLLFFACLAGSAFAHGRRPLFLLSWPIPAALAAGGVVLGVAALLGGSAVLRMRRHRTPIEPGHAPTFLVTDGPFALSRNPLYLTLVLVHAAIGVMVDSAWVLGGALLLLVLLDRMVIPGEEREIGLLYGDEYAAYRRRVRRWI